MIDDVYCSIVEHQAIIHLLQCNMDDLKTNLEQWRMELEIMIFRGLYYEIR